MRFSAREQYGLRAMAELARRHRQGPVALSDIATAEGLPLPYLEQVVASLRQAGLVSSTRGARGGYELARPPDEITAGDVIRALEGTIIPIQCLAETGDPPCVRESCCATRSVWEQVRDQLIRTLDSIYLADLQAPLPVGSAGAAAGCPTCGTGKSR